MAVSYFKPKPGYNHACGYQYYLAAKVNYISLSLCVLSYRQDRGTDILNFDYILPFFFEHEGHTENLRCRFRDSMIRLLGSVITVLKIDPFRVTLAVPHIRRQCIG
jgi:hypothetical protein